jgi:hypothetical protein
VSELNPRDRTKPGRARRRIGLRILTPLAVGVLALPLFATSAAAAPKVDPALVGLYGSADPTYDGVFRQSLGLLGILAAKGEPADEAVQWLLDQQCSDGGFMAFNPDPGESCVAPDPVNFAGEDTNSAALAAQALAGLGRIAAAKAAIEFLDKARNSDGGWPYIPGGDSDPNSTGLALMALSTDGTTVDQEAVDYVAALQVGCGEPAAERGGVASPFSGGAPDVLSTVQVVPGIAGLSLLAGPASSADWVDGVPDFSCPVDQSAADTVAGWGSAWLQTQVAADAVAGGNTGWAVLSFASTRTGHDAAESLYAQMVAELGPTPSGQSTTGTAKTSPLAAQTDESPGALGLAALAGATLGEDVSGLSARIAATMTAPAAQPTPTPTPTPTPSQTGSPDDPILPDTGGIDPWLIAAGIVLVVSGASLVVVTRPRREGATGT